MSLPVPKTSRLWMKVLNKDWWDVVLLHFTYAEWKQHFRMTGHSFITLLFTRKNSFFRASYVITLFLRHCTCAVLSSFGFQSDQVFTCPLIRITKGIKHPLRSDRNFNQIWPIQSDWCVYMTFFIPIVLLVLLRSDYRVHVNAANVLKVRNSLTHSWRLVS